jgi:nucleotide-binding universal stress UspA family protein
MNQTYQKIMLVTDSTEASKAAEISAMELAKRVGARVLIVDTLRPRSTITKWLTSKYEDTFNEHVAEIQERLENLAVRFRDAGVTAKSELLFGRSSEEIVRKSISEDADLVIRYMKGSDSRRHLGRFGATAINLMRLCPCPLLLVGDKPVSQPKVLACVDAEHQRAENQPILSAAEALAPNSANLHAIYCWTYPQERALREHFDRTTLNTYLERAKEHYQAIYNRFIEMYDMQAFAGGLHLEDGDPSKVIPEICRQEGIDVVVVSSASLNHPLQLLLGSTVEALLNEIPCSMLVVKPVGFQSPVTPSKPGTIHRHEKFDAVKIKNEVTEPKAHVTVFDDLNAAKSSIEALLAAGFSTDNIELLTSDLHADNFHIETPRVHETTGESVVENAAKWGGIGAAAGALSAVFAPFPGLALGMIAVGGITGAIMGGIVGVEHAVEDDSVNLPTIEEYEQLVKAGNSLLVVRGSHKEIMRVGDIINDLFDVRSHIHDLHGHEFHEHPVRPTTERSRN